MKRVYRLMAVILIIMLMPCAMAEMYFSGSVTAGSVTAIKAPYGAVIDKVSFDAGDRIEKGDIAFTMATDRVYAPCEGTVTGVFGSEGDLTDNVNARYGAVMYIEPVNKYMVTASTEKAYNLSENKFIHIGETVYLCCTADGSHQGKAIVTGFGEDAKAYTLEVTSGEFSMEETVGIFRSPDFKASSRIGRGTVAATSPVPVQATGSIIKLHVKQGDIVERGEILFETVESELDGLFSPGSEVKSEVSGVVAAVEAGAGGTVEKGGSVLSVYADDDIEVHVSVPESELGFISVGQQAVIEFNWDANQLSRFDGTVTRISYISDEEGEGEPSYTASIAFTPDATVRLGMTVTVYIAENEEELDENDD